MAFCKIKKLTIHTQKIKRNKSKHNATKNHQTMRKEQKELQKQPENK